MIIIKKKKMLSAVLIGLLALTCFASGAIASSHLTKITAYLNSAISVDFKGKAINLADQQPITYKNTNYLPLRTIAEATGLDVQWNQKDQRISLTEKKVNTPGVKKTFSKHEIDLEKGYSTDLLLKPSDITFSNKQYNEVVKVTSINTANKGFYLTFPEGSKSLGVTFGTQDKDKNYEITYKIYDLDDNVVSEGKITPNSTTYVEFELSDAGNKLFFSFERTSGAGDKTAYLVYDESWYK